MVKETAIILGPLSEGYFPGILDSSGTVSLPSFSFNDAPGTAILPNSPTFKIKDLARRKVVPISLVNLQDTGVVLSGFNVWCCMGDFNHVGSQDEKLGGR